MKFGAPAGAQYALDGGSFTFFLLIVSAIGTTELAVTNIAVTIQMLAFVPIGGMHWGIIILVGQYIGKNKQNLIPICTKIAFIFTLIYMGLISLSFLLIPDFYLNMFEHDNCKNFDKVLEYGRVILVYLAIFTITDAGYMVYAGVLKGAGDTKFPMWVSIICAWLLFIPAVYIAVNFFEGDIYTCWIIATIYIVIVGLLITFRYFQGSWRKFDVIDQKKSELIKA